jgi:hypothetical protein
VRCCGMQRHKAKQLLACAEVCNRACTRRQADELQGKSQPVCQLICSSNTVKAHTNSQPAHQCMQLTATLSNVSAQGHVQT